MERTELLSIAAIVIALLAVGLSYATVNDLKAQVEQAAAAVEETKATVDEFNNKVTGALDNLDARLTSLEENATTRQDVEAISISMEELRAQINDLARSLADAATTEDLDRLASRLDELASRVEGLEESLLFPATVVDGTGSEVVIPSRPERIVSLAPSATETLYFIGALDRIVGVDSFSDYPPEIRERVDSGEVAVIGGFADPSVEEILALEPDLVVGVAGWGPHEKVKLILESMGVPVVLLPQERIDDVRRSILILGVATGNIEESVAALREFDAKVSLAKYYSETLDPVRAALIVWVEPIWVAGGGTFQNDVIEYAGGVNVFANMTGWATVSPEELLAADPEVIILTNGMNATEFISYLEGILGDAAYNITAVKEGRIYAVQGDYNNMLSRPSPRVADAISLLLYLLHPDLYGTEAPPSLVTPDTLPEIPMPPVPVQG